MPSEKQKQTKKVIAYTKYSGMVYQLFGMIALTIFLGMKADSYFENEKKYITVVLLLIVISAYFYKIVIEFSKK